MASKLKTLEDYAKETEQWDRFRNKDIPPQVYYAAGLVGEAGEVMEEVKKSMRTENSAAFFAELERRRPNIVAELGDVLWYFTRLMVWLDISHEEVFNHNAEKLKKKYAERGHA